MTVATIFLFAASILAGAIGAVSGFGIGSVLTPIFSWQMGAKLAVAAVSLPHFFATAYRCWLLRADLDRQVLMTFGLASAVGGLAGAYLHTVSSSRSVLIVFGLLLILTAAGQISGFWDRLRFGPKTGFVAGVASGLLGGFVGNQGGIRTAAMFGFHVRKEAFVATGTAAALIVDLVRVPVYVWTQRAGLGGLVFPIFLATVGALAGTWIGTLWLRRIPEAVFRRTVAILLFALGAYMLWKGIHRG